MVETGTDRIDNSAPDSKESPFSKELSLLNTAAKGGASPEFPAAVAGLSKPQRTDLGPTNPATDIKVTLIVKSKASEAEMDKTIREIAEGKRAPLNDSEFNREFGADPKSMSDLIKMAGTNGLKVLKTNPESGEVELEGKASDLASAFNVKMEDYRSGNSKFRIATREHNFSPRAVDSDIEGVFGLSTEPQAEPQLASGAVLAAHDDSQGYMPGDVANIYHFPKESRGEGQSVGVIELGGGLDLKDNAQYYKEHGLKAPEIQLVNVDGAKGSTGGREDIEVALDSQIIGAVAPDAKQQLVFAPNTDQGFVDAITRATFPENGERQNSALSISWGAPEGTWSKEAIHNLDLAFKKAALKGISVFAASGDYGATNNSKDGTFSVVFPASDPYVTGTGGTALDPSGAETAWNDSMPFFGIQATGGGISQLFDVPDFQKSVKLPADANGKGHIGRGVPDIASDASVLTGYKIRVGGHDMVEAGTSAAAPLAAALIMRVNGALGHPVGYLNPFLYKHGGSSMFNDVKDGNNNGYSAGPGWDATTGWGSIQGDNFLKQLRKENK